MDSEIKEMFEMLLSKMDSMQSDIVNIQSGISNMKSDISNMKSDIVNMKNDISNAQSDIIKNGQAIHDLHMLVETETNRNIMVIAEAHGVQSEQYCDLKKVVESIRTKQEMTEIRLNLLEADIRFLKNVR